jgi:hypothetical protein
MAMRFAGFEVRDCIQWLYGSGFPKSHNISKAIDKMYGAEREVVGVKITGTMNNKGGASVNKEGWDVGQKEVSITAPTTDQAKQWDGWGSSLKPANEPIVLARKPLEKGLSIAENVLKWGVGAINIDGCRVSTNGEKIDSHITKGQPFLRNSDEYEQIDRTSHSNGRFPANLILTHHPECECVGTKKVKSVSNYKSKDGYENESVIFNGQLNSMKSDGYADENGEETIEDWECHSDCPIKILDQQSGESKSSGGSGEKSGGNLGDFGFKGLNKGKFSNAGGLGDKGGASRFFYVAKASKSERNKGLELEKWFYNLELITESCSFTEQNLFIWEQEELNQNMDLNMEVQQKKDISEGTALLVSDKECCITLNGKSITELFPKAIKFTTKMGLSLIIELKTSNYYQHLNTNDCIVDVLETNKENGLNLAENVGLKNLLKLIFTKDKKGFPLGVKIVAKETQPKINVKDAWFKSNIHSTVKPIKLMQYLVRLITPPNGIVLDPFCGSGTTGVACKLEGFMFVGMEQDPEYTKIAQARIGNHVEESEKPNTKSNTKPKKENKNNDLQQLNLF